MTVRQPNLLTVKMAALVIAIALFFPLVGLAEPLPGTDQDQPKKETTEAGLVQAFKGADAVFTAKIGKVQPLGHTNSIPASVFGRVTFRDLKPLRGGLPEVATFSYSYREGATRNLDLSADGQVLVATRKMAVLAIVPATEANLALAKKAIGSNPEK